MLCPNCNTEINEGSDFCSKCGVGLVSESTNPSGPAKKSDSGCMSLILLALAVVLIIGGIIGFLKGCS